MAEGTGADTDDAHSGGLSAEIAASRIIGTAVDFEEAITQAKNAAGKVPGVTGWNGYSDEHADNIRDVEEQCMTIAGNIQDGAEEVSRTDQESGDEYSESGGELSRPINHGNVSIY